jgi:hypothetical protein
LAVVLLLSFLLLLAFLLLVGGHANAGILAVASVAVSLVLDLLLWAVAFKV